MASAKDIAVLERKLKEAKSNREKIVLAKELKDLKSKLSTTQKQETLPTQRRKIRMLSSAEFNELIARLKQKPEYSFLKSMGKKKIQDDYRVVGKPVGWRIKGKDNYKVPSKRFRAENPDLVYYENRINRSDVRRPNRLEQGGEVSEQPTARGGMVKMKYYKIIGKNRYVSITYYTEATSVANAKQHFYIDAGTEILYVMQITKKTYETYGGNKMATGGKIENQYKGMSDRELWDSWRTIQKTHFLEDHRDKYNEWNELDKYRNSDLVEMSFDELPKIVQKMIREHRIDGQYATGGSLKKKDKSVGSSLADAKKRVAKMSDDEVVEEISTIFYYEMQDNDTDVEELYDDIATARKELAKHYAEQNDSDSYAKGGKMKKSDLVEYVVPNWSVPCLINGDFSGLNDEDEKSLDSFIEQVKNECGNAMFMLGDKSDDYGFSHRNDVDSYAGDVTTLYIMPNSSYAKGGGVKKKVKTQPAPTPNANLNPMDSYNVELVESQGKDDKGTYYMFPKPADKNSKGVLFKKGGMTKKYYNR